MQYIIINIHNGEQYEDSTYYNKCIYLIDTEDDIESKFKEKYGRFNVTHSIEDFIKENYKVVEIIKDFKTITNYNDRSGYWWNEEE